MAVVRYLEAFRGSYSRTFLEAMQFEIEGSFPQVAATRHRKLSDWDRLSSAQRRELLRDPYSWASENNPLSLIGLLVASTATQRAFIGDCWSERRSDGTLMITRSGDTALSRHNEIWCKPEYVGLVISIKAFRKSTRRSPVYAEIQECIEYAQWLGLPIYVIKDGTLILYHS